MANAEKITELIDEKALLNWEKFVDSLDQAQSLMAKTAIQAAEINRAMGQSKSMLQYSKNAEQAALAQEKIRQATLKTQQAEERLIAARKRNQQAEERASRQEETRRKRQQAQTRKLASEYSRLDAELSRVRTRAQDVAAQMFRMEQAGDTTSNTYLRLQKRFENLSNITQLLDGRIKQIDSSLGKHQRNVGNYRSAFDGLGHSINQLTREAPAFAVSFQTGILALSNNIPILFDEITKLRVANQQLAAEGKKVIPVWRQLIRSFLSWQTVLSLSVTLLTVYGKEIGQFLTQMFGLRKAVDQVRASQEAYNESIKSDEFKESIQNVIEIRSAIALFDKGLISSQDIVKRYNETIGQTTGELKTLKEVEDFIAKDANNYIQMTLYKAAANLQLAKAAEMAAKVQEDSTKNAQEFATFWDQFFATVKSGNIVGIMNPALAMLNTEYNRLMQKAGEERRKAMVTQNMKDRDTYIKNAEALLAEAAKYANALDIPLLTGVDNDKDKQKQVSTELKLQQFKAQVLADTNKKIAENDKKTYDERYDAADIWLRKMKEVIELQKQMDLETSENAAERVLAEEKASSELQNLAEEDREVLVEILKDQLAEQDKLRLESWNNRKLQLEQQQSEELQLLNDQYLERELTEKEYQTRRKDIAFRYAQQYIAQEIRALEELIAIEKGRGKDVAESERELARLKIKYSEEATKKQIDDLKKVQEAEKEIAKLKQDLAREVFNLGIAIFEANIERELQDIDRQEEQLEKRTQKEIDAANAMALTEEEKQQRIIGIEKRAEAERENLEQRRRQAEVRQARFQKNTRMMEAVVSTAAGVARAFADYIFPYSAIIAGLVGALGAVQIATIASAPIPQYFRGTKSSPEGLAHVGEKGQEILRFPDGTEALSPNTDTLTWLPKGTEVLTNEQTKKYLAKHAMESSTNPTGNNFNISPLVKQQALTNSYLKRIQKNGKSTVLTKSGLVQVHQNGTKWSNYLKRNGL